MTTAWAYIRVSGDDQADRGLPVEGQRASIQAYAEQHGVSVARWYVDEARTGGNDRRDAFQRLMADAHEVESEQLVILLWSWSRFARSQDDAHFWKASLRRRGVDIRDVSGETPDQLPAGFEYIFESLIHWKDAQKLAETSRDARRGQQTLAQAGYIPSGCRPPRGYRTELEEIEVNGKRHRARRWVADPDLWPIARRAWEMRLAGRSYKDILQETRLYKTPGCLSTFFSNRSYTGKLSFGGTIVEIPALVTEEEWTRVNEKRQKRRSGSYARRQGSRFLLSGLLTCARCGSPMGGDYSSGGIRNDGYERNRWDHYRCLAAKRGEGCGLPRLDARELEGAVIESVFAHILTPENLESQLAIIEAERDRERPVLEAQLITLKADLHETGVGIDRLLDAIEAGQGSRAITERLAAREADQERIGAQIAELEARIHGIDKSAIDVEHVREVLKAALDSSPPAQARELLKCIIAEIIVDEEEARIKYKFPFALPTGI